MTMSRRAALRVGGAAGIAGVTGGRRAARTWAAGHSALTDEALVRELLG